MRMKNKKAYNIKNTSSAKPKSRKLVFWLIGLAIIIGAGLAIYTLTRPDRKEIDAISTNNTTATNQTSKEDPGQPTTNNDNKSATPTNNDSKIVNLAAPSGTFVSSHSVSLSSSSVIASTCNTTPGAKCTISFTNQNGVVRFLAATTADKNGTAYWTWSPKSAQLTTGSWRISATAKSGDQSKTSTDPQPLEVSP